MLVGHLSGKPGVAFHFTCTAGSVALELALLVFSFTQPCRYFCCPEGGTKSRRLPQPLSSRFQLVFAGTDRSSLHVPSRPNSRCRVPSAQAGTTHWMKEQVHLASQATKRSSLAPDNKILPFATICTVGNCTICTTKRGPECQMA